MRHSTMYQFRIDEHEKAEAFAILEDMGLKPSQAIRLFLRQVRKTRAMPFPIEHIPNDKTAEILSLSDPDKDLKRFETVDDLMNDLNDA
jgi:addiction module RelB/DinJ family antitoxin